MKRLNKCSDCQIVVICGRNTALVKKLKEKAYPEGMHVSVNGFINNMNEWMTACDAVITKAGPGTIAEALICGTPILLNGYVPGQVRNPIAVRGFSTAHVETHVIFFSANSCTSQYKGLL